MARLAKPHLRGILTLTHASLFATIKEQATQQDSGQAHVGCDMVPESVFCVLGPLSGWDSLYTSLMSTVLSCSIYRGACGGPVPFYPALVGKGFRHGVREALGSVRYTKSVPPGGWKDLSTPESLRGCAVCCYPFLLTRSPTGTDHSAPKSRSLHARLSLNSGTFPLFRVPKFAVPRYGASHFFKYPSYHCKLYTSIRNSVQASPIYFSIKH